MKILHTADLHLGVKNAKLSLEKQKILKEEQLLQVKELFEIATKENYDFLIISGDLFHTKNIPQRIYNYFFEQVLNYGKPVIYIIGNHDEKLNFSSLSAPNFFILDEVNKKYHYDGVTFWSAHVKKEDLKEFFDKTQINILLGHGDIFNEKSRDYLDIKNLLSMYTFDYVALGHIHSYHLEDFYGCKICYPGCLFSNGFDECGEKGYVSVNVNKNDLLINFIPFSKRKYVIKHCDITYLKTFDQIKNAILNLLKDCSFKDLIRVYLTGYFDEETNKFLSVLKDEFSKYFYFEIIDDSKIKIDFNKIRNEKLSFKAEFLSIVENSDEKEENKNKIMQLGIEALKGDDLSI